VFPYENDVSAEKQTAEKRAWVPETDANEKRPECVKEKKDQRKKGVIGIRTAGVVFLL